MTQIKRYNNSWMPSIFDEIFDNAYLPKAYTATPAVNVAEDETSYTVEVAAPGMSKEDFSIHIDSDSNLVISMEKKAEQKEEDKTKRYLRREFAYSKFQQSLILPEDVDKKGIGAHVENGVLTVTLPKQTQEQKQQLLQHIEVK